MSVRTLRIFMVVYELQNMTMASKKLYISQPAISQTIKQIEEYYEIQLFERIGRRLLRTEASHKLYEFAQKITSFYRDMDDFFFNYVNTNHIRVGSSITVGTVILPTIIKNFNKTYPNMRVSVKIDNSEMIENLIMENSLELAIIEGTVHNLKHIMSENFMDDSLVAICGISHPLARINTISLELFTSQNFILREKGSGTREFLDKMLQIRGLHIFPTWESISTKAIINAVTEGIGISVLPKRLVEKDLDNGLLVELNVDNINFERYLSIIYLRYKVMNPSTQSFISFLRSNCSIK